MKEEILSLSCFWDGEVKEISNEEFSFDNFNKMNSGNGFILLSGDRALKYSVICNLL